MNRSDQFMVLRSAKMPDGCKMNAGILKAILRVIHDHSSKGKCWASVSTIAKESCFCERTVVRSIAELERLGLVKADRREGRTTLLQIDWNLLSNPRPVVTPDCQSPLTVSHHPPDCQSKTSDCQSPETIETVLKPERESATPTSPTLNEILQAWNSVFGTSQRPTKNRAKSLRARLKDRHWRDNWREAIQQAGMSSFLRGENDRKWRANMDWFLKPDSVTKILEGTYGNGHASATTEVPRL